MIKKAWIVPPKDLIAYAKNEVTKLTWSAVPDATGYYIYSRPLESADGDYSKPAYTRVNKIPISETGFCDKLRIGTYRVTAIDRDGDESGFSDMVYPIRHDGLEILSVRYYAGKRILGHLPDKNVHIEITAVNCCEKACILATANYMDTGKEAVFGIAGDGVLHSYDLDLGDIEGSTIVVNITDYLSGKVLFTSKYRPEGEALFDTLFERGLSVCEPYTEVLYDARMDGEAGETYIKNGKYFQNCSIEFGLDGDKNHSLPFSMLLGNLSLSVEPDGTLRVRSSESSLDIIYNAATACRKRFVLHVDIMDHVMLVFSGEEHIPCMSVQTDEAHGGIRFLENDWSLSNLRIVSKEAAFAGVLALGCKKPDPIWDIACWHSHFNWIREGRRDPTALLGDGSQIVRNEGRSIWRSGDGTEVILEAKGSKEYTHTRRRDEGWSHLLLEVLWNRVLKNRRIGISDLESLWITMDIKLLYCENKTKDYQPDIHAGQFVVYFNIGGAAGESMWLSLCDMDSRYLMDENRRTMESQMDPGTNTFIISPPMDKYINGHLSDGQWHSMSVDLKPVIFEAYQSGKRIGAFKKSSYSDLYLNSMNLGFELPGSFDMAVKLSNMQLAAKAFPIEA